MPAISQPYCGASASTSRPIRPWPISSSFMDIVSYLSYHDRTVLPAKESVVYPRRASARRSSASRCTSVMFRRAAACETMRIGTPPDRREQIADERRIVLQALADRAEDRHVVLARDVGDAAQASR